MCSNMTTPTPHIAHLFVILSHLGIFTWCQARNTISDKRKQLYLPMTHTYDMCLTRENTHCRTSLASLERSRSHFFTTPPTCPIPSTATTLMGFVYSAAKQKSVHGSFSNYEYSLDGVVVPLKLY